MNVSWSLQRFLARFFPQSTGRARFDKRPHAGAFPAARPPCLWGLGRWSAAGPLASIALA